MELAEPLAKKNKDIEIKIEKETGKKTKKKKSRGKKKKPDSSDDDHGICMDSYDVEDSSDADYSKRRTKKKNVVSKKKKNDANESDVSEKKKKKRKKKRIVVESDEDIDSNSLGSDDHNNQNSDDELRAQGLYAVESIINKRLQAKTKKLQYHVKWAPYEGHGSSYSWVDYDQLDAPDAVESFQLSEAAKAEADRKRLSSLKSLPPGTGGGKGLTYKQYEASSKASAEKFNTALVVNGKRRSARIKPADK